MKYLVLLLIVMGGIWWIRQQRPSHAQRAAPPAGPEPMMSCLHCGAHAPQKDMVSGRLGLYCSATHRQAHEG